MINDRVVRSSCAICPWGCGVLIHLKDGKPVKIEGDPESPISKGEICVKGLASLEYLNHPDRLKHPLKRMGQRGEGNWKQITWDEALDVVARELTKTKENYGVEAVAFISGVWKGFQNSYLFRIAHSFGTPNIAMVSSVCELPRILPSVFTCGFYANMRDLEYPPACIVAWGANVDETNPPEYQEMIRALDRGTKLIVIDPKKIELVSRADLWIQPRPGSDLALALGMINVIINEGLYDKAFVDRWTVGFDELKAHVQAYPPEKVAEITWVDAETIKEAARFYATHKPACIQWGNALDHNRNSFQAGRALSILRGICGNLGVPGGDLPCPANPTIEWNMPEFLLRDKLPAEKSKIKLGADLKLLPIFAEALPQSIIKSIIEEDPYPIRAAYIQGCNPIIGYSNAKETLRALKKLDFIAIADMFMTPTAALADIVLPVKTYLEFDGIGAHIFTGKIQVRQKVAQIGECRSDYEILSELAKKLDLRECFPWDNYEQCLDYILKPTGVTFSEFRKIGAITNTEKYRSYEANGFKTPSGKVELVSSMLKLWGLDPLPVYNELPETPYSDPELAKEYPLILTSYKSKYYRHSEGKQIASLRGGYPDPVVHIHPDTASNLGIKDGDWVYIETKRGRIKQKAFLTSGIDPRVVSVAYAWWYPEKGLSELYGWEESNINVLTNNKQPYSREIGSPNMRGILCKVYKSK